MEKLSFSICRGLKSTLTGRVRIALFALSESLTLPNSPLFLPLTSLGKTVKILPSIS